MAPRWTVVAVMGTAACALSSCASVLGLDELPPLPDDGAAGADVADSAAGADGTTQVDSASGSDVSPADSAVPADGTPLDEGVDFGTPDCSVSDAASTAGPASAYVWALWPIAPDSPGSANYVIATICGDAVVIDKVTGLMWARDEELGTYTQNDAITRCTASRRGGFTNWRLPTRIELASLVDYGRSAPPLIDPTAFPTATSFRRWTSSRVLSPVAIDFSTGQTLVDGTDGTVAYRIRCVR